MEQLGVSFFLRKPVSYQDVAGAIRTLIASRLGTRPSAGASPSPSGADRSQGLTAEGAMPKDGSDAEPASRR